MEKNTEVPKLFVLIKHFQGIHLLRRYIKLVSLIVILLNPFHFVLQFNFLLHQHMPKIKHGGKYYNLTIGASLAPSP